MKDTTVKLGKEAYEKAKKVVLAARLDNAAKVKQQQQNIDNSEDELELDGDIPESIEIDGEVIDELDEEMGTNSKGGVKGGDIGGDEDLDDEDDDIVDDIVIGERRKQEYTSKIVKPTVEQQREILKSKAVITQKKTTTESWYVKGYEGIQLAEEEMRRQPTRFWMREGETKEIIFLDDKPFCIYEHQLFMNGNWFNYFTCLYGIEPICPICEAGHRKYYIGLWSIVDRTSTWTDKSGKVHKNEIKVFGAKTDTLKKLERHAVRNGGLRGCVYSVYRSSSNSASCGDDFEFKTRIDLSKYPKLQPFDFEKICKPLPASVLASKMSAAFVKGDNSLTVDEDIPF